MSVEELKKAIAEAELVKSQLSLFDQPHHHVAYDRTDTRTGKLVHVEAKGLAMKIHKFEAAGMGKAPFKFVGMFSMPSPSMAEQNPEGYQNAMREIPWHLNPGACRYCGMPIMHHCIVQSADGKTTVVGSDCIEKVGDAPLTDSVKREKRRFAEVKRTEQRKAELEQKHAAQRERNGGKTDDEIRQEKADIENQRRSEISSKITALLAPLADMLKQHSNYESDFCDTISKEMMNGIAPKGRAASIVMDILAKREGRSGSKKYDAEYDRIAPIFDEASDLEDTKWIKGA